MKGCVPPSDVQTPGAACVFFLSAQEEYSPHFSVMAAIHPQKAEIAVSHTGSLTPALLGAVCP